MKMVDNLVRVFSFLELHIFKFHPLPQNSVLKSELSFKEKIFSDCYCCKESLKKCEGKCVFLHDLDDVKYENLI